MKAMIQVTMMVAMVSMTVACGEKDFDSAPVELQSTAAPGLDGSNGSSAFPSVSGTPPVMTNGGVSTGGVSTGGSNTGTNTGGSQPKDVVRIEEFVAALYKNLFNRPQETAGYIYWSAEYRRGVVSCSSITMGFLRSAETSPIRSVADASPANRAQYIQLMYMSVLGRYPDQPGFDFWLTAMNGGLGATELENALVDSPEFRNRCQSFGLRY
jgi:hypothetical protein